MTTNTSQPTQMTTARGTGGVGGKGRAEHDLTRAHHWNTTVHSNPRCCEGGCPTCPVSPSWNLAHSVGGEAVDTARGTLSKGEWRATPIDERRAPHEAGGSSSPNHACTCNRVETNRRASDHPGWGGRQTYPNRTRQETRQCTEEGEMLTPTGCAEDQDETANHK